MRQFISCGNAARDGAHFQRQGVREDIVLGVGGILCAFGIVVGGGGVHGIADVGREGDLGDQQGVAGSVVDMDVDMRRPAGVPAREDGGEADLTVGVRHLSAPQEVDAGEVGRLHAGAAVFGVVAVLVAMPDIDDGAFQRFAAVVAVLDRELDGHGHTRAVGPDIRHDQSCRRLGGEGARRFAGCGGAGAVAAAGSGDVFVLVAGGYEGRYEGDAERGHAFFQKIFSFHQVLFVR